MIDADALRMKYRQERDKRLRPDGNAQYVRLSDADRDFLLDPHTPVQPRQTMQDSVQALIIGGGFSGLLVAARLKEAGIEDVRVVDRAGDFGGTWYWNRYPGAQCDIESYIYLPLLEELDYIPQKKYSNAPEIFAHSQAIARHYGLYANALLHTGVKTLHWDDARQTWLVTTDRGDAFAAGFVFLADGPLTQPKLPGIAGIHDFKGQKFHTSRWNYAYTGGDANGGMHKLADKRVGVIGTGATAVQCIPYLAQDCQHLYVFQRTPSSILERNNQATDPNWAQQLQPGWQRERIQNFNRVTSGSQEPDLVDDSLTRTIRELSRIPKQASAQQLPSETLEAQTELNDFAQMEQVRGRVAATVKDAVTAEALKPWYRLFCKRPCYNDEYLSTFNRHNVSLVDTGGKGVTSLSEQAVHVGEQTYPIDCLVFATGFEVGTEYPRRSGFEVFGRDGLTLTEHWSDGIRSLHGLQTHKFPNCFFLGVTQGGYTANYTHMVDEQARHIAYLLKTALQRGAKVVEVSAQAERQWVDTIQQHSAANLAFFQACTPGYYNNEGQPEGVKSAKIASFYGGSSEAFFEILQAWRDEGNLPGLMLGQTHPGGTPVVSRSGVTSPGNT